MVEETRVRKVRLLEDIIEDVPGVIDCEPASCEDALGSGNVLADPLRGDQPADPNVRKRRKGKLDWREFAGHGRFDHRRQGDGVVELLNVPPQGGGMQTVLPGHLVLDEPGRRRP